MNTSCREFAAPGIKLADEDDDALRLLRVDDAPLNLLQYSPRVAWQHQFRARERARRRYQVTVRSSGARYVDSNT